MYRNPGSHCQRQKNAEAGEARAVQVIPRYEIPGHSLRYVTRVEGIEARWRPVLQAMKDTFSLIPA